MIGVGRGMNEHETSKDPRNTPEPMNRITPSMKVADVIDRHPGTVDVFLSYDCPDMRGGFFRLMARMMSVRAAAWIHGIPLEDLLADLNERVRESEAA